MHIDTNQEKNMKMSIFRSLAIILLICAMLCDGFGFGRLDRDLAKKEDLGDTADCLFSGVLCANRRVKRDAGTYDDQFKREIMSESVDLDETVNLPPFGG